MVIRKTLTRKPCRILVWRPRDSCPKTAESMLESHDIHARTARKASPNTAKIMLTSRRIHVETQPECCRPPTESRADSASLLRIPNAQRARGVVFGNTEPAPRRASPRRATDPQASKTTASIGVPAISQHHFTANISTESPERSAPLSRIASQSISGVTTSMDIARYRPARPRHRPPSSHHKVAVCGARQQLRIAKRRR